jgi:subtilisin family serine protease
MRVRVKLLVGLGLLVVAAAMLELLPLGAAGAAGQVPTHRVIVVLRNQLSNLPASRAQVGARHAAAVSTQAPLVSQLSASGARNLHGYTLINAVSATVSSAEEQQLRADPAVREVVPDRAMHLGSMFTPAATATTSRKRSAHAASAASNACAAPGQVQLNPEALSQIHADSQNPTAPTARTLGFTGKGVTVGFLADGLDINNPDFIRPNGQHVFIDYKDFSGNGTSAPTGGEEAFGDAASIAAQGRTVYNVAGYGPEGVSSPCKIRIEGVAPGASLVGLVVVASGGIDYNSTFLQGIDYAVTVDHVNVLNESLGVNDYPDDPASLDLVKAADDAAVAAGTTVTVSTGDAGVTNTIGSPASDPNLISAGATTSYRLYLQAGYGGAQFPGVKGYLSNNISALSSGGFDQMGRTIDLVAPGDENWAPCSTDVDIYADCFSLAGNPSAFVQFGGTSEAAPLTAGVAALVYEAYRKTHGAWPDPRVVKQILTSTAQDIGAPADQQGSGEVDAYAAVLAAESYQAPASTPPPTGNTSLKAPTQLNAVDPPSTPEKLTARVTNDGASPQTFAVSSRTTGAYRSLADTTVTLSDTSSPHTTDYAGRPSNYEPVTFTVPAGQARLNASIAYQGPADVAAFSARVRITLVDPSGRLALYSLPQGVGNYGNAQVTDPQPGTWTAYVWSRESTAGGTTGPVRFDASVAPYAAFGSVSPSSLTLAPGQSSSVTLSVSTPGTPGDAAGSIVLTSNKGASFARQTTIPVTLRSLIPNSPTSFQQTLTGGNGRSTETGQTFYYQFDVPAGRPELNANVTLADNPNNPFTVFLISPSGQALGQGANELTSSGSPPFTNELGGQVHVLSPAPGKWTLIVAFVPQVSGTAITEPFTVSTNEQAQPASAGGLPSSSGTQLGKGTTHTYQVQVTNTSSSPAAYFVDPRLNQSTTLTLAALNGATVRAPLSGTSTLPLYLVPTHTTAVYPTAQTKGSTPIMFDAQPIAGDPDIGSTTGKSVYGSFAENPVAIGAWDIAPDVVGPFGTSGVRSENVTTAMTSTSDAFDSAVSSSTGDMWQASVNPGVLRALSPVIIGPGQTGTITVTLTPDAAAGTHVNGTLYVDVEDLFLFQGNPDIVNEATGNPDPNGSEVAAIPYSYTVK